MFEIGDIVKVVQEIPVTEYEYDPDPDADRVLRCSSIFFSRFYKRAKVDGRYFEVMKEGTHDSHIIKSVVCRPVGEPTDKWVTLRLGWLTKVSPLELLAMAAE